MPVSLLKMIEHGDPVFAHAVAKFEETTGHNSEDIRLDQEVQEFVRLAVPALGLDPNDTPPKEFYHGLNAKFLADDALLVKNSSSAKKFLESLAAILASDNRQVWAIKPTVLKKIIKANPPKNLISQLGYRSIDSMLKREKPGELLLAATQTESAVWRTKLQAAFKKVKAADFGPASVEYIVDDSPRWQKIAHDLVDRQGHTVLVSWLSATIFVLVPPEKAGVSLANLFYVQEALQTIVAHSSLLRFVQVSKKFHLYFTELLAEKLKLVKVIDQNLTWAEVAEVLAGLDEDNLQERFGLHIAPEDFMCPSLVAKVAAANPHISFWTGPSSYCVSQADTKDTPVSLNPLDAISNLLPSRVLYPKSNTTHGVAAMKSELLKRYISHDVLKEQVLLQLEHL